MHVDGQTKFSLANFDQFSSILRCESEILVLGSDSDAGSTSKSSRTTLYKVADYQTDSSATNFS